MNTDCNNVRKKVSVITSYYIYNYGSVLQAYATQMFFAQMGFEVEFVNYVRENVRNHKTINSKWNSTGIKRIVYKVYKEIVKAQNENIFGKYIGKHLQLTEKYVDQQELYMNPPHANVYCVGSDQMWNSEYNGGVLPETFLTYAPMGSKKISFSSSMGMSTYPQEELHQMKTYLEDFALISVREKESVEILSREGIKNVYLFLDPTLLIPAQMWKKEMAPLKHRRRYVLVYQLNVNPHMLWFARKLAEKEHLELFQITYSMFRRTKGIHYIHCPSVERFLSLLYSAEYIVTDSFHGTAFSINFNRNFYAFNPPKYNNRIKSILDMVGLSKRLVNEADEIDLNCSIDFNSVNRILESEREYARAQISILDV